MKTRTWIASLILLSLTASLWALSRPATTAVQAADPPRQTRQGAWLDSVVFTEEGSAVGTVSKLQADELDLYAYSITDPSLFQRVLEEPNLDHTVSHDSYNELTFNPYGPTFNDGRLNPFSVSAIREAMNRLIDRNYIAQVICGGMTKPRWLPVQSIGADHARYQATVESLEAEYAYDPGGAEAAIAAEMTTLGATLVDGKWHYNGEPVVLIALIRVEDERLEIGDYVADQMEAIGFTVDRQYKTSAEASSCWLMGDPTEGCFHFYTGGWVSTAISRDESSVFGEYYTPLGWGIPLWQAYTPSPEFYEVAEKLWNNDFTTLAERDDLFELALDLAMEDSVRVYLKENIGITPRRAEILIASDLAGGVYGAEMWPYVARFDGIEGGAMRVALPLLLDQPWNPVGGSNWVYDMMAIRATQDYAFIHDPNSGLVWPQRAERAEVVVQDGLPVTKTMDWVDLSFAPQIDVPGDAWVDWDAANQQFITAADAYPAGLTAKVKSTVYYPADLFSTVTWHDGNPLDLADFVMRLILTFDRGKPESEIYDEGAEGALDDFMSHFRGVKIESTDPLVITTYDDEFELDAELSVVGWWPNYARGPGAWHNLTAAIRAEAAGDLALSQSKADDLGVPWADFVAGSSVDILDGWMDLPAAEDTIPYEPTLGDYIDPAEADSRWANLQAWYAARGHFWLGTGPFFLDSADPDADTLTLLHNPDFPDLAGRWDAFDAAPSPDLEINYASGAPGSYLNVTGSGFPPDDSASIVVNGHLLGQLPVESSGEIAFTLTTEEADAGTYHLRVSVNPSGGVAFVLHEDEPVRPREGALPPVEVPDGLITYPIYLPLVVRNWP
jgi:peptide/nickel transport system substrate-binding protein